MADVPKDRCFGYPGLVVRTGMSIHRLRRLVRANKIPHRRPTPKTIAFSELEIREWWESLPGVSVRDAIG